MDRFTDQRPQSIGSATNIPQRAPAPPAITECLQKDLGFVIDELNGVGLDLRDISDRLDARFGNQVPASPVSQHADAPVPVGSIGGQMINLQRLAQALKGEVERLRRYA